MPKRDQEPARTRQGYDQLAETYAARLGDELLHKPLDRALLDTLAAHVADGVCADVGCGPGHVAAYLAGRGVRVTGADLAPQMCAVGHRTTGLWLCAGDLTALPYRTGSLAGVACMYAVIHLDRQSRAAAYAEIARVLRPGGQALVSFHVSDADVPKGGAREMTEMWGTPVDLTFRFLDPDEETTALEGAGLRLVARLDRQPYPDAEHPSRRGYLLAERG